MLIQKNAEPVPGIMVWRDRRKKLEAESAKKYNEQSNVVD